MNEKKYKQDKDLMQSLIKLNYIKTTDNINYYQLHIKIASVVTIFEI